MEKNKKKFNRITHKGKVSGKKRQKFYCTVCKMKTWTYHLHNGANTSSTIKNTTTRLDITNTS